MQLRANVPVLPSRKESQSFPGRVRKCYGVIGGERMAVHLRTLHAPGSVSMKQERSDREGCLRQAGYPCGKALASHWETGGKRSYQVAPSLRDFVGTFGTEAGSM